MTKRECHHPLTANQVRRLGMAKFLFLALEAIMLVSQMQGQRKHVIIRGSGQLPTTRRTTRESMGKEDIRPFRGVCRPGGCLMHGRPLPCS